MTEPRRERADAARNRRAILAATEELLTRHRPEQISLEQVAIAAGVGKGTVFHRFGNRTGLMRALMEERAQSLQEAATSGPPPLGPGAPARQRLLAFLDAIIDVVTRNVGLLAALDHALTTQRRADGVRHHADTVYQAWHDHISALIASDRPDLDTELLAHILLSPLHSGVIQQLLQDGESARIAANLRTLATSTFYPNTPSTNVGTDGPKVPAARAAATEQSDPGDEFAAEIEAYRHELRTHCYRMLGSFDDAEDLVQDTMLRAWRARDSFEGRSSRRAWLYRIATNACLDFLRRNPRTPSRYQAVPGMASADAEAPPYVPWLQPYPDVVADGAGPEESAVSRETLELVFLAAIQHLPPRQRAVLIARDVLEWPAADVAQLLDMSVASVNSALQRARPSLRTHLPRERTSWVSTPASTHAEQEILERYMAAARSADVAGMATMLADDARLTMPPNPMWFQGRDAILDGVKGAFDPQSPRYFGKWRHLPTRANGAPAAAGYVQRPGTAVYRAQVLDVLRIVDGKIAEITSFEPHLFPAFGLPLTLR